MPIRLDALPWRTDFSSNELISSIRRHGLPAFVEKSALGNVPDALRYCCETVVGTKLWPLQDDFVPLWTTNATSCLAFEPSINKYTFQHVEDVQVAPSHTFDSIRDVAIWVLLENMDESTDEDIKVAANFFEFSSVDTLLTCNSVEDFYELDGSSANGE